MRNNRHARTTIIIVTIAITAVVTSLFVAAMTIVPRQADALSIYMTQTLPTLALTKKKLTNHLNKMITPQQNQQ